MSEERRNGWNKRQIDDIEDKVTAIFKIMNGNGRIGLVGKVDIMWGYRGVFVGLFGVNLVSLITVIVMFIKL